MIPFDPTDDFESAVLALNSRYRPGSVVSGQARNVAIWAWAMAAGKERASQEVAAAVARHGSRTALCRLLQFSTQTFRELEAYILGLPEAQRVPESSAAFRAAFDRLPPSSQQNVATVFVDLLQEPELLAAVALDPHKTKLLQSALRAADLRQAIERLSQMLASGVVEERAYQSWCDDHSWVFGGAHLPRDDVRRISPDSIVDMLHPDVMGYRDIVELKRPDAAVLRYDRSHDTYYFSPDASKAIGQAHKYMDRLHEVASRELLPGLVAYHPRTTIVIGRSVQWSDAENRTLRGLNQRLHGIDVITYDHLLARAQLLVDNVEGSHGRAAAQQAVAADGAGSGLS